MKKINETYVITAFCAVRFCVCVIIANALVQQGRWRVRSQPGKEFHIGAFQSNRHRTVRLNESPA